MEMEINVINNKNFKTFYSKIRVRGKEVFIISFSSGKWTTWKNRSIDYSKHEYLPDKIVMKTCFSEEKLIKQFGPPFLRKPPFSTNQLTPYFWAIFLGPPSLSKFWK